MIFLSLRNNRKLSWNLGENIRKVIFGLMIAGSALLMIMSLDISSDQFKTELTPYDIHYLPTLIISMASMPLTMFILLAMNKNEYGRKLYKYIFEVLYMSTCLALSAVFYLHEISLLYIQVGILCASTSATLFSFILSRTHINYKATTMFGPLIVKPLSFDHKGTGVLGFVYLIFAYIFQGGVIAYFNFVDEDLTNYLVYQFLIQLVSVILYLWCTAIFSKSRSIGQSQEVLYYRYAQLIILSLIFILVGIGAYRVFADVVSNRTLVDNISIGLNLIPILALFIDLWVNNRRVKKNKLYQGMTEFRLLIKVFAAVTAVLVNMIGAVEVQFFLSGEVQANIDSTLIGLASILIIIVAPFFVFWKKITRRSSRILVALMFLMFSFIMYKFYFFADIENVSSTIFDIPVDSIYTMVTLLGVLSVQVVTIVFQARNSGIAFRRYSHANAIKGTESGVNNG